GPDDVYEIHGRGHRGGARAAEVTAEAGDAREDTPGSEVDDPNRIRHLVEVMAFGTAEDQVDIVSVTRDPPGELEHRPLGPAAVHVGREERHPLRRLRR